MESKEFVFGENGFNIEENVLDESVLIDNEVFEEDTDERRNGSKTDFLKYTAKKKRTFRFKNRQLFLKISLVTLIILCAFLTPLFNINYINVIGNSYLSEEKIIEASGIYVSKNIFTFQCSKVKDEVESLSFIDIANVKKQYPSGIVIEVKECVPIAQIKCGESLYIVVDKSGKVLDTTDDGKKYNIPKIESIVITEFELGKKIVPDDNDKFNSMIIVAEEIKNNGFGDITENLICEKDGIIIKLENNIRCDVGTGENIPYRVKFIKEVYKSIPEGKTGELKFIEEYKAVFTEDEKSD